MATAKKQTTASKVRAYAAKHPSADAVQTAKACGTTPAYVYALRHSDKNPTPKTPKQQWKMLHISTSKEPAMPFKEEAERIYELTKGRQRMHPVTGKMLMENVERITMEEPKADNVNHPAHYKVGGIETIDFIEAKNLNYRLGNVVKYVSRADHKGERLENLQKGLWYLEREIAAEIAAKSK